MRNLQWALLAGSVAIGIIWTFLFQNWLLLVIFPGLLLGKGMNLQSFLGGASSPAFAVLWGGCLTALIIWIITTMATHPKSSSQVRAKQPQWWLAVAGLVVFGWMCITWYTVLFWQVTRTSPTQVTGMYYYPVPPQGWILLMLLVVLDVILLFWLPTLLASPRTYRFVVPGAVTLLGSR